MKKRMSLAMKIAAVNKIGTIKSLSRQEAIEESKINSEDQEHINDVNEHYDRGLIYCVYEAYDGADVNVDIMKVGQFTQNLANFVQHVAYPINFL